MDKLLYSGHHSILTQIQKACISTRCNNIDGLGFLYGKTGNEMAAPNISYQGNNVGISLAQAKSY